MLDAGARVDTPSCEARLVIGPVLFDGILPSSGEMCAVAAARSGGPVPLRVHLFQSGTEVRTFEGACDASSSYVDLGAVAPGVYQVAVEVIGEGHGVAGAELIRPLPCGDEEGTRGEWCHPLEVRLEACQLVVLPAWLRCGAEGPTGCAP